ncbi:MAG: hypothetical protein NT121_04285 [Chloroflexi bacterium]|nr:hypothetical protein [Chloroflexota bacterium]
MKDLILRNPWMRTLLPLLLLTIASFTANTLVVEISSGSNIDWFAIPKKISFYILLVATIATFFYQVLIFKNDTLMLKGLTPKQYEAALRNQVLEDTAKRVKKLIQGGDLEELEKATETFKRLFGENI